MPDNPDSMLQRHIPWVALAVAACLAPGRGAAAADDAAQPSHAAITSVSPQREEDFIAIIEKARNKYAHAHSSEDRARARLALQLDMLHFVGGGLEAKDWIGIIRDKGLLEDGSMWLVVEVGDGIVLKTQHSLQNDPERATIITPRSAIFDTADKAFIGQRVRFSGSVLHSIIESDEAMVGRPEFLVHFDQLILLR